MTANPTKCESCGAPFQKRAFALMVVDGWSDLGEPTNAVGFCDEGCLREFLDGPVGVDPLSNYDDAFVPRFGNQHLPSWPAGSEETLASAPPSGDQDETPGAPGPPLEW
jgi:hypothetical protein